MARALQDVVVVLPGIMGSVLRDADGDDVWKLSLGSIVRGVLDRGREIKRLALPAGIGDDHPGDGVIATALMPDMHVVPGIWTVTIGYRRLVEWFERSFAVTTADPRDPERVVDLVTFPYDWRLSNRYNATVLRDTVEPILERVRAQPGRADAQLVFVAHSMGGLVARYYADVLGGHELTRKVVTLGTPYRGAVNALASLVNGVRKGFGPIGLDLTELARSLPALHQLLPEYGCIESAAGLRKTTELTALPELDAQMVADAMRFHEELRAGAEAHAAAYDAHPILARTQPTPTTARLRDGRIETEETIRLEGAAEDQRGDGTVPRLSAAPYGVPASSPSIRYVMEQHGALPRHEPALVELGGVLTATDTVVRAPCGRSEAIAAGGAQRGSHDDAPPVALGVRTEDLLVAGEVIDAEVETEPGRLVEAVVTQDGRAPVRATVVERGPGRGLFSVAAGPLPPGWYELRASVAGRPASETVVTPIAILDSR